MSISIRTPSNAGLSTAGEVVARCAPELSSIEAAVWNALLGPGNSPLRHEYLRAWERVELSGLCSRPVLAYGTESSRPIAACPGYFYDLDVPTVRTPGGIGAVRVLRRVFPRLLFARTYELGSPTPLSNPFLLSEERLRPRAVPEMIEAALRESEREGAEFVLVQNFTSRSGPAADALSELGFAGVPIPATAVVDLPYSSFDEYLGAMRAQYRRRARQTLRRSGDLRVEHLHQFGEWADELTRLWRAVYDRATEVKREILTPGFFRALSDAEETSLLLTRRADGSVASFAVLLDDHPWLSFLHCGFEAEAGRQEGSYFRLLYEIIRVAIEGGYEQVDLGITTLVPKLDAGAVPVPLFAWVKHRNRAFQRIIRVLAQGPLRPPALEPRRVFKEPPPTAAELAARRLPVV